MKDWLEVHGERMDGIPLYVNILVVRIGKEVVIFRIKSGDESLLHFVDLAHHHGFMFHNPEWYIAFDHDPMLGVAGSPSGVHASACFFI